MLGRDLFTIADRYQIWPIIMEKAYGELLGDYDKMKGNGSSNTVWQELLGTTGSVWLLGTRSKFEIETLIRDAVINNQMVVLSSLGKDGSPMLVDPENEENTIARRYAYIVESINANAVSF